MVQARSAPGQTCDRLASDTMAPSPRDKLGPGEIPAPIGLAGQVTRHMDASVRTRSLRMVLLFAAAYLLIGLAFADFSDWATTNAMRLIWRRLAWLVSGVGFASHIAYGHFRLGNSPRTTAMQASIVAALGDGSRSRSQGA